MNLNVKITICSRTMTVLEKNHHQAQLDEYLRPKTKIKLRRLKNNQVSTLFKVFYFFNAFTLRLIYF